ncbi:hypothetical protein Pmar_PMAR009168 [Perkinsus marinus ATCC 50983]|uniref:Uncharacterized protein n=1 Tax=Perkinsus marinus (strain ATCC 50983 / TXsc) TaxID=423536 RepID=C5KBM0_PERM5|nr:hypothetical protein Pmar_PMAR009168 [Perkinsus marinus ATCC 50983]EER18140.1 hypothetical protein Pmar_PMAR009168 [Perkinsus marinus ATCC 50983]|eukprot:XP_002786344.1 hypothetical protein Pmar_PMAR009168 [Perkinsus marinus ATCC 50983]
MHGQSTVRTLQRDADQERHTSELRPGIAGLRAAIPPLPSASVLHPADRDQAVEMLSRTTKELEKVTDERDLALSEARMLKLELDKREQKIHSLTERCGDLQHDDAEEEVLPSLSSSLTTTPRNGDNEEEDDDRGTLERLIDALTGRGEDETETEHVLHSLEHVVERLSQRCRVLEAAVVDAKQELKWWRTGGGTATFNEAYAKVMAENERHLRLEGQRHSKEKSDLRHSLAQKENKRFSSVGPLRGALAEVTEVTARQ